MAGNTLEVSNSHTWLVLGTEPGLVPELNFCFLFDPTPAPNLYAESALFHKIDVFSIKDQVI